MMERRLLLARALLNPRCSVLVVAIDEKEYLRLGLLLEQIFPEAAIQMVTSVINPMGSKRANEFSRVEEYLFVMRFGTATVPDSTRTMLDRVEEPADEREAEIRWTPLNRDGNGWERAARPNLFYPILIDPSTLRIVDAGDSLALVDDRSTVGVPEGLYAAWPMKGTREARWQVKQNTLRKLVDGGWVRVTDLDKTRQTATIQYLTSGAQSKVANGSFRVSGRREDGSLIVVNSGALLQRPRSVWIQPSHSGRDYGTSLLGSILPERKFPFPKSLYAVEDMLRFFVSDKPDATVVDFFSGSGTTAHALMRINHQDGGRRRSISITNNEVSSDEQRALRKDGFRPGDPEWDRLGICDYITKPRIEAVVRGRTPDGAPITGDYKFTDQFPIADGFNENVEFFTLTYESAMRVSSNREFRKIAPFLWFRAGSRGRRIDDISAGWDVAEAYGVIANLDLSEQFIRAVEMEEGLTHAFIVTDEDRLFEAMVRRLPDHIEPVRLYSSYLRNFEIEAGRSAAR